MFIHTPEPDDWRPRHQRHDPDGVTSATPIVLMVVGDSELAATTDRIVAAVGAHRSAPATPGDEPGSRRRRSWSTKPALCGARAGLPRRDAVLLVVTEDPTATSWAAAGIGAQHVCALPAQEADLVSHLAAAAEAGADGGPWRPGARRGAGPWGAGASVFAAALASCADSALILDPIHVAEVSISCWAGKPYPGCGGQNCRRTAAD